MRDLIKRAGATVARVLAPLDRPLSRLLPAPETSHRPQVIGHRGTPTVFPENSLPSLEHAVELGVDGVEFDVIVTRDDVPVVCHDREIVADGGTARLDTMTWREVQTVRLHGERLPNLTEALGLVRGRVEWVYVHYKRENELGQPCNASHIGAVAAAISGAGMIDTAVVMVESGQADIWHQLAPEVQVLRCWAAPRAQRGRFLPDGARHLGILHNHRALGPLGFTLHYLGLRRCGTWLGIGAVRKMIGRNGGRWVVFTLNDPYLMRLYAAAGVDAVGSDDPGLAKRILTG